MMSSCQAPSCQNTCLRRPSTTKPLCEREESQRSTRKGGTASDGERDARFLVHSQSRLVPSETLALDSVQPVADEGKLKQPADRLGRKAFPLSSAPNRQLEVDGFFRRSRGTSDARCALR